MKEIVRYLMEKYKPHGIILYGSYASGTNNENSDFDALVITDIPCQSHDGSRVAGVELDVFIYNTAVFSQENAIDYDDFVQIFDGNIILDEKGLAKSLKASVIKYVENKPHKTTEEKQHLLEWCEKMLSRGVRNDAEGHFRLHWLLVDSLEIYFNICNLPYWGPKKALITMKNIDQQGFEKYSKSLKSFKGEDITVWINHIKAKL